MRLIFAFALMITGSLVHADGLPAPEGPVILTVSGNITHTNGPDGASFDRAMIEALARRTTVTSTPWYDEPHSFEGPLASAILDAVGAKGNVIRLIALNDYASEVPIEDARTFPVILATHLDGQEMSVRDKGPLFLIYPFDEFPELFNEVYFGRSVWQISRIEVLN